MLLNLLENKERLLTSSLLDETKTLIHQSLQILNNKHDQLRAQETELNSLTGDNKTKISELIEDNQNALIEFQKKSLSVKPSQRLLERQTKILLSVVGSDALSTEVENTLDELVNSRTTIGLFRQMKLFFIAIRTIMTELSREAELTNKMAVSLYKKFSRDFGVELLEPKPFPIVKLNRELNEIIKRSEKLDKNVFITFIEHSVAVKRFFSGTVTDVMNFFKNSRKEMINWSQNIINPLNQQLRIHHHMIMAHREELEELRKSESNIIGKLKAVNTLLGDIESERQKALELSHALEHNRLIEQERITPDNIVPLSSASRRKI